MTYIVRPCIEPAAKPRSFWYISLGAIQLLVGPASSWPSVQMYVDCSTRATSFGLERW